MNLLQIIIILLVILIFLFVVFLLTFLLIDADFLDWLLVKLLEVCLAVMALKLLLRLQVFIIVCKNWLAVLVIHFMLVLAVYAFVLYLIFIVFVAVKLLV